MSLAFVTNFDFDFTISPNASSKMSLSDKFQHAVSDFLYFASVLSILWTKYHHFWLDFIDFLLIPQKLQVQLIKHPQVMDFVSNTFCRFKCASIVALLLFYKKISA